MISKGEIKMNIKKNNKHTTNVSTYRVRFCKSQFFSSIIGVIIGGLITFLSSYYFFKSQNKREIRNITQGFYIEICSLEENIFFYEEVLSSSDTMSKFDDGLYPSGLYLNSPSDIFKLDFETAKLLFKFYNSLLEIDRLNKYRDDSSLQNIKDQKIRFLTKQVKKLLIELKTNLEDK